MRRRDFIAGVAGTAALLPTIARTQQPAMPVLGFFHVGSRDAFGHLLTAFHRGLAESDLAEGRNVAIEYRWAEGQLGRLPALAAELVKRQPAVIVVNSQPALAMRKATATIPIVFVTADDPVRLGFVKSLNRPGGNMTGVYQLNTAIEAKRLGLLRDMVPQARTIAVLIDANFPAADAQLRDVEEASVRLGVRLVAARVHSEGDFNAAFANFVREQAGALLVCASPFFNSRRVELVVLAARHNLPAIYELREFAVAGGLVSYGNSIVETYRNAGIYAGRVVKGTKPVDLPVVQSSKFEMVINARTARALGVKISDNLITLADEVIE